MEDIQALSCAGWSDVWSGGSRPVLFEQRPARWRAWHALTRVDGVDLQSSLASTREATAEPVEYRWGVKMSTYSDMLDDRIENSMALMFPVDL